MNQRKREWIRRKLEFLAAAMNVEDLEGLSKGRRLVLGEQFVEAFPEERLGRLAEVHAALRPLVAVLRGEESRLSLPGIEDVAKGDDDALAFLHRIALEESIPLQVCPVDQAVFVRMSPRGTYCSERCYGVSKRDRKVTSEGASA